MIKDKRRIIELTLIVLLAIIPSVSAAPFEFNKARDFVTVGIDNILGILSPFFETIIGDYYTSEFFFHKILLFILLVIICKNVLDKTPLGESNKKVSFAIAIIISILGIRFINENDFFEAIFIQYGVLGIAITTILPIVIFFFFINKTNIGTYGRKVFWTLYGLASTVIWLLKSDQIPAAADWIYGLTTLAAIIFIFFDKSIHAYFGIADFKKFERNTIKKAIREAKNELWELKTALDRRVISWEDFKRERDALRSRIKELSKE